MAPGMRKLLAMSLALIGALLAVLAGTGAAILITHTYLSVEYSVFITLLSAAVSWRLFCTAREQFRKR
jgi:hypothetical protein